MCFSCNEKMTEWQPQRFCFSLSSALPLCNNKERTCERLRMYGGRENELLLIKMMRMVMLCRVCVHEEGRERDKN